MLLLEKSEGERQGENPSAPSLENSLLGTPKALRSQLERKGTQAEAYQYFWLFRAKRQIFFLHRAKQETEL